MGSAFGYATVAIIVCRMNQIHYTHLEAINSGMFLDRALEKHPISQEFGSVCTCQVRSATSQGRPTLSINAATEDVASDTELAHVLRLILFSPGQTVVITTNIAIGRRRVNHESSTRVPCIFS